MSLFPIAVRIELKVPNITCEAPQALAASPSQTRFMPSSSPTFALHQHCPSDSVLFLPQGRPTQSSFPVKCYSFLLAHRWFLLTFQVSFQARLPQTRLPRWSSDSCHFSLLETHHLNLTLISDFCRCANLRMLRHLKSICHVYKLMTSLLDHHFISSAGFHNLSAIDLLGWIFICCRRLSELCGYLANILDL